MIMSDFYNIPKDLSISITNYDTWQSLYSKGTLITRIKVIRSLLNGKTPDGRDIRKLYPSFRKARYCLALLAAIKCPGFEESTVVIDDEIYINPNQLQKVATSLGLEFDRSTGAEEIYGEMRRKNCVKMKITDVNRTFYTITSEGEDKLLQKLQDIEELNRDIDENPMLQSKLTDEIHYVKQSKGAAQFYRQDVVRHFEELITKIANWD
jgi:hypothetical protein